MTVYPTVEELADVCGYANDRLLVVLSFWNGIYHGDRRMGDGVYDARTDIETSPLDPELHDEFTSMLMWDREIGEGTKRGPDRERIQSRLRVLKSEELSEDFVIGYALALGLSSRYFPKLRARYQSA